MRHLHYLAHVCADMIPEKRDGLQDLSPFFGFFNITLQIFRQIILVII